MRKVTAVLLGSYAALVAYISLRAWLGLEFQRWVAYLLPLLAFTFALLHAWQRLRWWRTLRLFALTVGVSLLFESLSVQTGLVYGAYHYTDRLGPMFMGWVPYLIPLTWFMMLYPAYILAVWIVPAGRIGRLRRLAVPFLAGLVMVSWDLVLDPLMAARGHWVWETRGVYFGIPLQNFGGWWLTAFIILGLFVWWGRTPRLDRRRSLARYDRQAIASFAIIALGNVIDAWFAGLVGPALIGLFATQLWVVWAWRSTLVH